MSQRRTAFIHSPEIERFSYPPDCPFKTERAGRTRDLLVSLGLLRTEGREERAPVPTTRDGLEKFHAPEYVEELVRISRGQHSLRALEMGLGTPDCPMFAGVYDYALWACGASLTGAEMILAGDVDIAFNPSGGFHHARAARAAGFCYTNDVVLACLRLAAAGQRVAFLDLDAHHADGVQDAFYSRNDVMVISLHESGETLFPGTGFEHEIGEGPGLGFTANVPLPAGTYDQIYQEAFERVAVPLIGAYQPTVIVLELGMDTLAGDPLTHLSLTNNAYPGMIRQVMEFGRPILATGGGGYHVDNTVRGWARIWSAFCGADEEEEDLSVGLGGVMLESTEWLGGLRDRAIPVSPDQRESVDSAVRKTIQTVRGNVFPYHGLSPDGS